jgi:hypothetical protein
MATRPKTGGGSRRGRPNRYTSDVRRMILDALEAVGGRDYLVRQARENPIAFADLLRRSLPREATDVRA